MILGCDFPKKMITYIGTNHYDPKGPKRLETLLNYLSPDIITVESSAIYQKLVKHEKQLSPNLSSMHKRFHYEWDVSKKYAKKHSIQIHPIDDPQFAYKIGTMPLIIHRRSDEKLYGLDMIYGVLKRLGEPFFGHRDRYMADRIREFTGYKNLIHISGAGHVVPLPKRIKRKNLNSPLKSPNVILLPEADELCNN